MIINSDERSRTDEEQAQALALMDQLERVSRKILACHKTEHASAES